MKRYILKKKAVAVAGRVLDDMTQTELEQIYLSGDRRFIDQLDCDGDEESVISDDVSEDEVIEKEETVIEEEKPKKKRTSKRKKQEDESE